MGLMILAFLGIACAGMLIGGSDSDTDGPTDAPVDGETDGDGLDDILGGETDPDPLPEETPEEAVEETPVHSADDPHLTTVTVKDSEGNETITDISAAPDWNGALNHPDGVSGFDENGEYTTTLAVVRGTTGDDLITVEGDARAIVYANDGADTISAGLGHIIGPGNEGDSDDITITIDNDTLTDHPELRESVVYMNDRADALSIILDDDIEGFIHRIDTEIDVRTSDYGNSETVYYETSVTNHYTHYVLTDSATPPPDDYTLVNRNHEGDERIYFEDGSFGEARILTTVYTGQSVTSTRFVYTNDAETSEVVRDDPYDTTPPEIFINRTIASTQTAAAMDFNGNTLTPRRLA